MIDGEHLDHPLDLHAKFLLSSHEKSRGIPAAGGS
jgi:hypothetical protein